MSGNLDGNVLKSKKGSAVVICVILFISFVFFSGIVVESASRHAAEVTVETAFENAGRAVLSCYDRELQQRYGIFALEMSKDEIQECINKIVNDNLADVSVMDLDVYDMRVDMDAYPLLDADHLRIQITEMMKKTAVREALESSVEYFRKTSESVGKKEDILSDITRMEKERDEAKREAEKASSEDNGTKDENGSVNENTDFVEMMRIHNHLKDITAQAEESVNEDTEDRVLQNREIYESLPSVQLGTDSGRIKDIYEIFSDRNTIMSSLNDNLLIDLYISAHFDDGVEKGRIADKDSFFSGEIEYILFGDKSDAENCQKALQNIFLIRSALDLAYLVNDPEKISLIIETSEMLTPGPFSVLTKLLIAGAWSAAEASNDVANLKMGNGVSLIKNDETWMTDLDSIFSQGVLSEYIEIPQESDMDYKSYLGLLLMTRSAEEKLYRIMDLYQINMKGSTRKDFTVQDHITGFSVDYDVIKKSGSVSVLDQHIKGIIDHVYITDRG